MNEHDIVTRADRASAFLHMRVTRQAKARWRARAALAGVGLSAWVRRTLDDAKLPTDK